MPSQGWHWLPRPHQSCSLPLGESANGLGRWEHRAVLPALPGPCAGDGYGPSAETRRSYFSCRRSRSLSFTLGRGVSVINAAAVPQAARGRLSSLPEVSREPFRGRLLRSSADADT